MKRKSYIIFAMTKLLVFVACTVQFFSHLFLPYCTDTHSPFMPCKKLILKKTFPSPMKVFKISLKLWKKLCNLDYQPQLLEFLLHVLLTKYRSSRIWHKVTRFLFYSQTCWINSGMFIYAETISFFYLCQPL